VARRYIGRPIGVDFFGFWCKYLTISWRIDAKRVKRVEKDMPQVTVSISCKGRDFDGEEVLSEAVLVQIGLSRSPGSSSISVGPKKCPHNTGGHM
jgi:hypothetical protein